MLRPDGFRLFFSFLSFSFLKRILSAKDKKCAPDDDDDSSVYTRRE